MQSTANVWTSPTQCHLGKAILPVPRGESLAGRPSGRAGGQSSDWSHLAMGVAPVYYTIALSKGLLVQAGLLGMPKHCPS